MDKREASTHTPLPVSVCLCCHLAAGGPRTHCPMSGRRVGFCLSDKKRRRMNLDAFADFCAAHGVEVVEIDLSQPLVPQGPFDVIVHKLSDVIVEAEHDSQSQKLLSNFQTYVSTHPSTVLLDPLPAMTQLLDRFASYRIMSKLHNSLRDWRICSPPYLEIHSASDLSSIQQAVMAQGLSFPLICKTRVAHGSLSHEMSLIFSAGSLADIHPPCVLQSFVNHGAVLHKVFVVGDKHFCVERPSLKNFPSGPCDRKTIFFNSHQVSKPESSSDLTALDEQMPCLPPPSSQAVAALVRELRVQLGMALFGVDVIINIHTHTLTVIDINIFPEGLFGVMKSKVFLGVKSASWPVAASSVQLTNRKVHSNIITCLLITSAHQLLRAYSATAGNVTHSKMPALYVTSEKLNIVQCSPPQPYPTTQPSSRSLCHSVCYMHVDQYWTFCINNDK